MTHVEQYTLEALGGSLPGLEDMSDAMELTAQC
jgi:hypothetical protein